MPPELYRKVRDTFDQVLELPESERVSYLERACEGDQDTFEGVKRLLKAHQASSSFLCGTFHDAITKDPAGSDIAQGTRRLGRYIILRELGRGAMGIVYEALDPLIGRTVAIKVIGADALRHSGDVTAFRGRLLSEARSAGCLSHPGIVTIYDVGEDHDLAFIAMERVNGLSLQQTLEANASSIDWTKALAILGQTARALDHAHGSGVIHRDIKPGNIMLDETGAVKITDFGIAKNLTPTAITAGTRELLLGTPSHMSPEQIEGKPLDGRSDQFSLAVVAFRLLTGVEPFVSDSVAGTLHKIVFEPRPSALTYNPAIPRAVDDVLQRALQRLPEFRFKTCGEFVWSIEKAAYSPAIAPPKANSHRFAPVREVRGPGIRRLAAGIRSRIAIAALAAAASSAVLAAAYFSGVFALRQPVDAITPAVAHPAKPGATSQHTTRNAPRSGGEPSPQELYKRAMKLRQAGDDQKAIELFRQAANLGDVLSMVQLGEAFMNDGGGVSANYREALAWLRKGADAGSASAMLDLGAMYFLGNGVSQDYSAATEWFQKAAAKGDPSAMYNLAGMYDSGKAVPPRPDMAKELYERAAALGNRQARQRLAETNR